MLWWGRMGWMLGSMGICWIIRLFIRVHDRSIVPRVVASRVQGLCVIRDALGQPFGGCDGAASRHALPFKIQHLTFNIAALRAAIRPFGR